MSETPNGYPGWLPEYQQLPHCPGRALVRGHFVPCRKEDRHLGECEADEQVVRRHEMGGPLACQVNRCPKVRVA